MSQMTRSAMRTRCERLLNITLLKFWRTPNGKTSGHACLVKPLVVELGDDLATLLKKDFTALFFSEILDLTVLKNTYGRLI